MATVTISGRVDESTKRLADMYIRKHGTTQAEIIANVWRYIADTGEIPTFSAKDKPASDIFQKFDRLRSLTLKGTRLSTMSADDLKKELSERE